MAGRTYGKVGDKIELAKVKKTNYHKVKGYQWGRHTRCEGLCKKIGRQTVNRIQFQKHKNLLA